MDARAGRLGMSFDLGAGRGVAGQDDDGKHGRLLALKCDRWVFKELILISHWETENSNKSDRK
jgi:hypothetical protein